MGARSGLSAKTARRRLAAAAASDTYMPPLDRTLGPLAVRWIERQLVHGPGDVEGEKIELDDERVRLLFRAYELNQAGRRLYDRVVISRGKGWAKSELAAMITGLEGLGPARFAGWDASGRPLGRRVKHPLIRCFATEEGQAIDNTYSVVEFMLANGPIARTPGLDVGQTRTFLPGGGKIMPVTARSSSKDGGKGSFGVFDETHLYVLEEHIRMHATERRNLTKRGKLQEPWSLETTTMYAPGEMSVAERSHAHFEKILAGAIRNPRMLFDHRGGPPLEEFDYEDDDELRAALAIAYGDAAAFLDLERMVAEARDPDTDKNDFCRYFLNLPMSRTDRWLAKSTWKARTIDRTWEDIEPGTEVVLGFDGSESDDSTAIVGCTVEETPHVFLVDAWVKDDLDPEWVVPRDDVDQRIHWCMTESGWRIVELAADPPRWYKEIGEWAERYGDVVVTAFRTNLRAFMSRACKKFHAAATNGYLTNDGDELIEQHIANAVKKIYSADGSAYISKDYRHSPRKIDAATAAVIAFDRATEARDSRQSAYDRPDKDVLVIDAPDPEWDDDEEDW